MHTDRKKTDRLTDRPKDRDTDADARIHAHTCRVKEWDTDRWTDGHTKKYTNGSGI